MNRVETEAEPEENKSSVRIAQQRIHPIKMNTENKGEKIQGGYID